MAVAKHMLKTSALLAAFAVTGTAVVAITHEATHDQIAENERMAVLRNLNSLVPATQRDNDMVSDTLAVTAPDYLGSKKAVTIYRARKHDQPVAAVFETMAPDGYNGNIKLLVAIHFDGTIAGVRVVSHRETPGLGDAIEIGRSNWLHNFAGRSLSNPTRHGWNVKKDGGVFDQFTGATITPRAVVKSVHRTLQYFSANRDDIFTFENNASQTAGLNEVKQ